VLTYPELEFDEALDRHIWSLSDQRLKWHKEIAGYRRTRPEEIERALLKSLARHHMSDMDVAEDPSTYHELMRKLSSFMCYECHQFTP
jgi:DnaJ-domain-containing protein 1